MAGWKVVCVQERRSHAGHVGVEVRRFDPEDEDEFAQFEYREADCDWTVHHYAVTRRLDEDQVGIYDRARLNVALPAAVMSFFGLLTSLALTRFRRFSQVFPKKLFGSSLYNADSNSVSAF